MKDIEVLIKKIEKSKIYMIKNYNYFVYPFKGIEPLTSAELLASTQMLEKLLPPSNSYDLILTFMTDGIILALPTALKLNKRLWIARDHHYHVCNIGFDQLTGYLSRKMYLNAFWIDENQKPLRIIIVDAIISTGGTVINSVNSLSEKYNEKIMLCGVYALITKPQYRGCQKIRKELEVPCKSVFSVYHNGKNLKCILSNKGTICSEL